MNMNIYTHLYIYLGLFGGLWTKVSFCSHTSNKVGLYIINDLAVVTDDRVSVDENRHFLS